MSNNTYDSENHIYRIDGVVVPSVTQVLTDSGLVDDHWFTEKSRKCGQTVAVATALYDKWGLGAAFGLDKAKVPEQYWPYVQAWIDWRGEMGIKNDDFILVEVPMWHEGLRYGGKPDAVAWVKGRRTVIEKKTGGFAGWHKWQTAGYREMLSLKLDYARMAVYLNPGKPAKAIWHEDQRDMDGWRLLLGTHHLKQDYLDRLWELPSGVREEN